MNHFIDGRKIESKTLVFVLGMNAVEQIVDNATFEALEERTFTAEIIIVAEVLVFEWNEVELGNTLETDVSLRPFNLDFFDTVRGECVVQCHALTNVTDQGVTGDVDLPEEWSECHRCGIEFGTLTDLLPYDISIL